MLKPVEKLVKGGTLE